jgi:1-acyl-sn-glycerol-3-phosphate acyltransferase
VSVFYWVVKAVLGPFLRVIFRPWAEGTDNVPPEGPAIIASNHLSFSDHFFAPLPLPRQVVFLAKSEYFTGRGLKGLVSKAFVGGVGGIPVDRSGGEASDRALRTGLRVLANGELLGIYPEGTRTPDGRLYRGKTGVARLALEARAPVIPCAMVGTFELLPPGKIIPRLRIRPGVRFGAPLDFSRYYGLESDRIVLRAVTDEIMYAIMKLSGQEYVDEYAKRAKARLPVVGRGGRGHGRGEDPGPAADVGLGLEPLAAEPGPDLAAGRGQAGGGDHGQAGGRDPGQNPDPAAGRDADPDPAAGGGQGPYPAAGRDADPDPAAGRDADPDPAAGGGQGPYPAAGSNGSAPGDRASDPDEVAAPD